MLIKTLQRLEHLAATDTTIVGNQLDERFRQTLLQRGWLTLTGYCSHRDVEVLDDVYEEVEVTIDEASGCYSYPHPYRPAVVLNEPLAEISRYRFQWQPFFDYLASLLGIEPRFASRRRCLVEHHLWYLGDVRIGHSHAFAPMFFGRQLKRTSEERIQHVLSDPEFGTGGVVLALHRPQITLPNAHQVRTIADLLFDEEGQEQLDLSALARILGGLPVDPADEPHEWFDAKTGRLKLRHLEAPVVFEGIQAKIIDIFWKARDAAPLSWTSDVKERSGSVSPTLDKAMGNKERREQFIEIVSRGKYRIRRS